MTGKAEPRGGAVIPFPLSEHASPLYALLQVQGEIIDMMANGEELSKTLHRIAVLVEGLAPPALCSIVLLNRDGKTLRPAAAPSLPAAYCEAIDGVEIGPSAGSCGTAAFVKHPVIVTDIATDPLWERPRDFTLSFGLRACWSMPIMNDDENVLGTIALYYAEPRAPTDRDWGLLEPAAKLVRLALAQNRREEELRDAQARWRLAAEATELGTFDVDLSTGHNQWSSQFKTMLGLPESAQASKHLLRTLVRPEDHALFDATFGPLPEPERRLVRTAEMRVRRADTGEERIVRFKGLTLYNSRGVATGATGTLFDVTNQRRREAELAQAKTDAERANSAKSHFLASMSHELRTPLNAILGFSDAMLQETLGPVGPPKYREYVGDIFSSGRHLLSLINDVLDMAKIEAGKLELNPEAIDVAELAAEALRCVVPLASAASLRLEEDVPRGLTISADARALRQILTNLLSNAVKFTKPGGSVTIFARRSGDGGLSIGVRDTGIGMTKTGIVKALQPFGQVAPRTTIEGRGTGLGLPIVKALVEAHGGIFRIESTPQIGTSVWGEFPLASSGRAAKLTAPLAL
jgi:PAS domain S-box-containing protein